MFLPTLPSADVARVGARAVSHRQSLWFIRGDDARALEIEFQGSSDGKTWIPYPFRYKPQDVKKAPGIYAPYQPRFDWNLWFASLGGWRENRFVLWTEERLLQNDADVLHLFAGNPFAGGLAAASRFARLSINIGSRTIRRSAKPAIGGGVNCWGHTRLLLNASRTAGLVL